MIHISNKQISRIINQCCNQIKSGSRCLEVRKDLQRGTNEINQGIGGLEAVQQILDNSLEIKTISTGF
jgi:hypothetical protein